ncbi:uncharacterized protein LOC124817216 [Hydra vulgaris]|uniref:uncharacterized protein LOC124817216 n=1 Tax=Hydra vulgaris TaxID=6087 RepID=UPI001F5FAC6A|nr:uncharacterized protein LOC124817216 [Hydra vulgaris]
MKSVVSAIIDQDELGKRGASAYVDDTFVNKEVVSLDYVKRYFEKYGLESKEGEQIGYNGVCISGLRVYKGWDDKVCDENLKRVLQEVYDEIAKCNPAYGDWAVHGDEGNVWVDASSLASGAVIQVGKTTVEDATWLQKEMSEDYINMAELDAVRHGMNMVLTWKLKKVTIFTDSVTVFHWVSDALTEYGINVSVKLVPSKDNLADALTRVRSRWLNKLTEAKHSSNSVGAVFAEAESISSIHKRTGHFGVNRTLNFVRKIILTATKNNVREVIKNCKPCQSIDPAPVQWEKGKLSVKEKWERVAMDITNFGTEKFLTLVDCEPLSTVAFKFIRKYCHYSNTPPYLLRARSTI